MKARKIKQSKKKQLNIFEYFARLNPVPVAAPPLVEPPDVVIDIASNGVFYSYNSLGVVKMELFHAIGVAPIYDFSHMNLVSYVRETTHKETMAKLDVLPLKYAFSDNAKCLLDRAEKKFKRRNIALKVDISAKELERYV